MAGRIVTGLRGYLNRQTPGYLIFFVTAHCPCRCKMCFNYEAIERAGERRPLDLDEIDRIARQWPGLHQINFSGGEPFLRKDLPRIVEVFYRHSGTRFITIPTCSWAPSQCEALIEEILERCPDLWLRITQSLDGVGQRHDEIRGRSGLFESVCDLNGRLEAMRARRTNLSVGIAIAFSRFNHDHAADVLEYAYRHLHFTDLGALLVRGKTRDPEAIRVEAAEFVAFQQACLARRRAAQPPTGLASRAFTAVNLAVSEFVMDQAVHPRYVMPCHAARRMAVMSDEGDIEPCEVLADLIADGKARVSTAALGNLRDFDYAIQSLLASDRARRVAREIVTTRCHCSFECAAAVNILYNPCAWLRVVKNFPLRAPRAGNNPNNGS